MGYARLTPTPFEVTQVPQVQRDQPAPLALLVLMVLTAFLVLWGQKVQQVPRAMLDQWETKAQQALKDQKARLVLKDQLAQQEQPAHQDKHAP